jgi:hypothetical protein
MAGLLSAGRKVSSIDSTIPQVFDTIDFIIEALWKDKDFLYQKYVIEGRSIAHIAAQILSSRASVKKALIEYEIKLRDRGKPGRSPVQIPLRL